MIDLKDFIVDKKYKKKFKAFCSTCGKDRGYKRKEDDATPCLSCAISIRNKKHGYSDCSKCKNLDVNDFIIKDGSKSYRVNCLKCGKDRGYKKPKNSYKYCMSCAAKARPHKSVSTLEQRKLRHCMKSNISGRLKNRGLSKNNISIFKMLPYNMEDLEKHLENLFQEGMTWDNYGKDGWEVDHIKPDSWFNYSSYNDIEFKKSWELNNLQPMWAKENKSKSNKYIGKYKPQD